MDCKHLIIENDCLTIKARNMVFIVIFQMLEKLNLKI